MRRGFIVVCAFLFTVLCSGQDDTQDRAQEYFGKGLNAMNKGDNAEAVRWYTLCLGIDSGVANARFNRATAYFRMGEYGKAKDDLDYVVERRPELLNVRMQRAVVQANMGLMAMAREDLDVIIRQDSTFPRAYLMRGRMKMSYFSDPAGACSDLKNALQLGDSSAIRFMPADCMK